MTIINLFLASSMEDLQMDRREIGDFIRSLNDRYLDRELYFRLFICENEDIAMADGRKQEQYNQFILDSQLFVILIFKKAGEYTIEEFNVAYKQFKESGAPVILTFFRQDGQVSTHCGSAGLYGSTGQGTWALL